jgi:acyl-CoA thioester hydrolase
VAPAFPAFPTRRSARLLEPERAGALPYRSNCERGKCVNAYELSLGKSAFVAVTQLPLSTAVNEYIRQAFGSYRALKELGFDFQIVKLLIEWRCPARFDDILSIRIKQPKLGDSSFCLFIDICDVLIGRSLAKANAVNVLVDRTTLTKRSLPQMVRTAMLGRPKLTLADFSGLGLNSFPVYEPAWPY